ncbi:mucin-2-like [Eleginops maclovinus]
MSKSSSLKVKNLFKIKSPDKESKERKRSCSLKDVTATSPRERSETLPANLGPSSPGDIVTLAGDVLPTSPKEKKSRRLLSFKMKRKKSKHKEEAGGEVFFPDELDSFHSNMSYDQISVSTECSFRTKSDWEPESSSMISFDMNQPHHPPSPSKFFKGSEEKKGVLDRLSHFFNKRKKSTRTRSDASSDGTTPTSPLSPCSPLLLEEDGLKTLTPSRKDIEGAEFGDTHSQSSSPSGSSVISLSTADADLPFADSNSSGRSSVREVHVCRVSTPITEKQTVNLPPTTLDLATTTQPRAESDLGFAESVEEEVRRRLSSLDGNTVKNTKDNAANQSSTLNISLSKAAENPKSPNLTSISLGTKKMSVKIGENGHSTALRGITLGSRSSTSQPATTQQEGEDSPYIARENKRRGQVFSWDTEASEWSPSPEKEQAPEGDSPVQLYKALWVETHLGAEEDVGREGEKEKDIMKQGEECFRADSPPVLAIPVTVIPEDDSLPQSVADCPSTPSETLPSESDISLALTTGEFQTTVPQPEEPGTGTGSKQSSLQEKRKSREHRVTRKSVNLPSKHKVFAHKVRVSPEPSLDGDEAAEEELSRDSTTTKTSDATEVKPLPSLQENNNVELKEANLEPFPTRDDTKHSETNTPEPLVIDNTQSAASDFDDTSANSDMFRAKSQTPGSGIKGQGTAQATPSKRGVKAAAESRHTTASGAKAPSSAAGSKAKLVTTKAKASTESTEVVTSSDIPAQREPSNDKTASMLPTLKDPSTSGPSSPTASKSKIPKRSASDADVKSPVTPDKTSVADASGSVLTSRLQRQPKAKEALKSPVSPARAVRKQSFEETKGGRALSGSISPTKTTNKTGTKLIKEKPNEVSDPTKLVNGLENDHGESSIKTGHQTDRESLEVKKQRQNHQESNTSSALKSRLPISSPTRKKNVDTTLTSGTNFKRVTNDQTDSEISKTEQKQKQQEVTPDEKPGSETASPLPESPKKGIMLSPRSSNRITKRSICQEDSDTQTAGVSPPPTKQEKSISSRLSKPSDFKRQKSPVPSPVSKLPTRGERSPNKIRSRKQSPTENSASTSASKQEDSNQNKASESVNADQVNDNSIFVFKSISTEEKEHGIKLTDSISENKRKRSKDLEETVTSPATEEISNIQQIKNNDASIPGKSQITVTPRKGSGAEVLPSSDAAKASSSQTSITDVDTGAKLDSQPKSALIRSENTKQEQETAPKICPEEVKEATQLVGNRKPDLIKDRAVPEPNSDVFAKDTIPEDVTDMSAKPVVVGSTHSDKMTHSDQDHVLPGSVSFKETNKVSSTECKSRNSLPAKEQDAEPKAVLASTSLDVGVDLARMEQQKELLKDQTTILENDRPPTLIRDVLDDFEEKSKKEVGKKPAEGLDTQTEAVTVCELQKNVENQMNKERLLVPGECERDDKVSKPNRKLNDTVLESADSQSSCKKELKAITIEDEERKDLTKAQKSTDLSSREKCSQPDSEDGPQMVVTDALEETKSEQARSALQEDTASLVDTKKQCEIKEIEESGDQENDQHMKTQTLENKQKPKVSLTKDKKIRDKEAKQGDIKTDVAKKRITKTTKSNTKEVSMQNVPNDNSKVRSQKEQKTLIAGDQDADEVEENANGSGKSNVPNTNVEKQPATEKAPKNTTESNVSQIDTTQELKAANTETQSAEGTKDNTETKDSPIKSLVNETPIVNAQSEISIQQDQLSIIVRDQHEDITKPDISNFAESIHPDTENQIQEQKDRSTETLTETIDPIKSSVNDTTVRNANSEVSTQLDPMSTLVKEQDEEVTRPVKNKLIESKSPKSNLEQEPPTDKTQVQKKLLEEQISQTDTSQELQPMCNEDRTNTDLKQEAEALQTEAPEKELESLSQDLKLVGTETQSSSSIKGKTETKDSTPKVSEHQIQELKVESTKTKSADGTKKKTETRDSSTQHLVNETATGNANYDFSKQKDQRSVIVQDKHKDTTKPDTNKSTESKPPNTDVKQEVMKAQTPDKKSENLIQEPKVENTKTLSAGEAKEKTGTKDLSVKGLVSKTPSASANFEVISQQDQKSVIVKDQHEDISNSDTKKSTESKPPSTDAKQEVLKTEAPEKKSENLIQEPKVANTKTVSASEAKEKTETKNSSVKSLVRETGKFQS